MSTFQFKSIFVLFIFLGPHSYAEESTVNRLEPSAIESICQQIGVFNWWDCKKELQVSMFNPAVLEVAQDLASGGFELLAKEVLITGKNVDLDSEMFHYIVSNLVVQAHIPDLIQIMNDKTFDLDLVEYCKKPVIGTMTNPVQTSRRLHQGLILKCIQLGADKSLNFFEKSSLLSCNFSQTYSSRVACLESKFLSFR